MKSIKIMFLVLSLMTLTTSAAFAGNGDTGSAVPDLKVYNVVTKPSEIVNILSGLIQDEKQGLVQKLGNEYDLTALSLAGYQVVKVTFKQLFPNNEKSCEAELTFNRNNPVEVQVLYSNLPSDADLSKSSLRYYCR